ncbi:MAG TPA: MmcQ/YjbR family DNA-binding protein [Micromonosporaceae bacterium]|nr:MmcQ/YjbR family DNA-binding protein [Micromonosporaceae bacterium]
MRRDELIEYCLAKPGAEESYPWGDEELVAKVGGKAFAFIGMAGDSVGVKCGASAEEAAEYRERYPDDVRTSDYIGRYGWNKVRYEGGAVPDDEVLELLDRSYAAIVAKLPKSRRPA